MVVCGCVAIGLCVWVCGYVLCGYWVVWRCGDMAVWWCVCLVARLRWVVLWGLFILIAEVMR